MPTARFPETSRAIQKVFLQRFSLRSTPALRPHLIGSHQEGVRHGEKSLVGQAHFRHIPDKASERICIEGFAKYLQIRGCCLGRIAVASRKYHWQPGIARTDFAGEPDAVDRPWHNDITENKI